MFSQYYGKYLQFSTNPKSQVFAGGPVGQDLDGTFNFGGAYYSGSDAAQQVVLTTSEPCLLIRTL